jgi:hypothetical protein
MKFFLNCIFEYNSSSLSSLRSQVLRPGTSTQVFLVLLRLQANAEVVPEIPSCYCVLLMQSSPLKFIKINPLAVKSNYAWFQGFRCGVNLRSPFWDVTQRTLVVTDVSEKPTGSIFKGQAVTAKMSNQLSILRFSFNLLCHQPQIKVPRPLFQIDAVTILT